MFSENLFHLSVFDLHVPNPGQAQNQIEIVNHQIENHTDVSDPVRLATDTSERWLYVLNSGSQTLSVWEINPTDGTLTKLDEIATSSDPVALHLNESL